MDPIFFPNVRELFAYWQYYQLVTSTETERSLCCLRQIHTWLCTTMTDDKFGNIGVLAMQGFSLPLNVDEICKEFVIKHNRRMCSTSV